MIKELAEISLKNPLEISKHNEIFSGSQQMQVKDFSIVFMRIYEYFNQMSLGLPLYTVISNYLVDLKVITSLLIQFVIVILLLRDRRYEV